jgi:hypothetical protein
MRRSIRFTKTLDSRVFGDTFADKGELGYVDDKDNETTNGVFVYVYTDKNPKQIFLAYLDEFEYVDTYVSSTSPKVDPLPEFTATVTYPLISNEMVEQCAKAMERTRLSKRDLPDEEFDAWWEGSEKFTDRKLLLKSVRAGLEAVLQIPY